MSINKARIRAKLAAMNSNGNGFWSAPKEGQATIRMFAIPNCDDPFIERYFHFNIEKGSLLCLKRNLNENGKPEHCPACELAETLRRSANPADRELSKQIYAKPRYYAAMVDRADGDLTPKYWGFGKQIAGKLMQWLAEDEGGDHEQFLDPKEGLDLIVSVTKTAGKSFADTTVDCKRRESPLCADKDLDKLMKSVKNPSELFARLTVEELQAKLDLLDAVNDDESEDGVAKGAAPARPAPPSNDKLDEMFAQFEQQ